MNAPLCRFCGKEECRRPGVNACVKCERIIHLDEQICAITEEMLEKLEEETN